MSSTTTPHAATAAHDDHHGPEAVRKSVRKYLAIGGVLYVLTVVTVAIAYLHLETVPAILLAMAVATCKASLVALFFMHLIDEKKLIYYTLLLTATFFTLCMVLPVATDGEAGVHRVKHEAPAAHSSAHH